MFDKWPYSSHMSKTNSLTAAERRTLGNIIAQGGTADLTQGRNRVGNVRKSVVAGLVRRGLVTGERLQCGGYPVMTYYATAAGCAAFGPEIARVS